MKPITIFGLTPTALLLRLAIVVFAVLGTNRIVDATGKTMSPLRRGFRAVPVDWAPWYPFEVAPLAEGQFEVPLLCPYRNSMKFSFDVMNRHTWQGPPIILVRSGSLFIHDQRHPEYGLYIDLPRLAQFAAGTEEFCTFQLGDGSFLVASTLGNHLFLDAQLRRLDGDSALERFGDAFGSYPVKGTLAFALLGLAAWLVFRRRRVNWLSFVGVACATCWVMPLSKIIEKLTWG